MGFPFRRSEFAFLFLQRIRPSKGTKEKHDKVHQSTTSCFRGIQVRCTHHNTHAHHNTHHARTQRRMNMFVHTLCPSPPPYHPKVRTYGGETGFNVHAVSIASISPDLSREEACPRGLLTFVRRRKLSMAKPVLIKQGITWQSKKRKESFGCWWIASFPIPTCRRSSSFSPAFPFVLNHPLPQRAHTAHTHAQPFLSPLHLFFPPLFISLPLFFSLIIVEDVKQAIALSHHGPP